MERATGERPLRVHLGTFRFPFLGRVLRTRSSVKLGRLAEGAEMHLVAPVAFFGLVSPRNVHRALRTRRIDSCTHTTIVFRHVWLKQTGSHSSNTKPGGAYDIPVSEDVEGRDTERERGGA